MGKFSTWSLVVIFSLLALRGLSQTTVDDEDDIDWTDDPNTQAPTDPPKAAQLGGGTKDFELSDYFDEKPTTKVPAKAPTKAPTKPKTKPGVHVSGTDDLSLEDALDSKNDIGGKDKNNQGGGSFSDSDLAAVADDDNYKPDKTHGGKGKAPVDPAEENNYDTMAETGTIAGIVSAVAMALVGAVSSYISYQKKKFCFSIQQSLNAELVKTDNPDAVVATEPQVQQTLLEPANAEPPNEENVV